MSTLRGWLRRKTGCGLPGSFARPPVPDVEEIIMDRAQPPLPAMAVLADGRFALRVAVRDQRGSLVLWEVRELRPAATEDDLRTGWWVHGYMDDAEVAAAGARSVEPLVDVVLLADELEAAGQFAAARIVRERAGAARRAGVGS